MSSEKLIPSLIEEDQTSLPKRGGNYVSEETQNKEQLDKMKKKLSDCNCYCNCDCNCNCDCDNCDSCDNCNC